MQCVAHLTHQGAPPGVRCDVHNALKENLMELADGAWIFLAFIVIAFAGVVLGYFTTAGGINTRPYGKIYSGAPGAKGRSEVSGRDPKVRISDWSRGTR
jgi:hypothetical protein